MKDKYNILYGQSYLLNLGIKLKYLDELESHFVNRTKKGILIKRDFRFQTQCVTDISEKIGFLHLSLDYIKQYEGKGGFNFRSIKYHFYNFVYNCKACLDSIAVLLNHQLNLGFKGGNRDFRKSIFINKLQAKSGYFKDFKSRFGKWCENIIDYRDRIIHTIGVPVFKAGPGHPSKGWKPYLKHFVPKKAISFMDIKPGVPLERVEIITFCNETIEKMMDIVERALTEVYKNINPE